MINDQQTAVINYIALLLEDTTSSQILLNIQELSRGVIYAKILQKIQGLQFDESRINKNPQTWTSRLSNFKVLFKSIQHFYTTNLKQQLEGDIIDLVKISKQKDIDQILKFFKVLIVSVFIQASNKSYFIQKILKLKQQQQSYFASLIKTVIGQNHHQEMSHNSQEIYQHHTLFDPFQNNFQTLSSAFGNQNNSSLPLLEKLGQLQEQNGHLKSQVDQLQQKIQILEGSYEKLQKNYQQLTQQLHQTRSAHLEQSLNKMQQNSSIHEYNYNGSINNNTHSNILIQNLKQKLLSMSVQHEKQIMKYQQQIEMMQNKITHINQLQETIQSLQEKLQGMIKRIQTLQKKKKDVQINLSDKQSYIRRLQTDIKQCRDKITALEIQKFNIKLQNQKIYTRTSQFQNQVKKKFNVSSIGLGQSPTRTTTNNNTNNRSSRLSQICPQIDNDTGYKARYEQLQQQVIIHTKRIKQLQKQLSKCKLKAQRGQKLQQQKKKLQQILVQFTNSRGQQVQILTNCLFDLRMRYKNILKKLQDNTRINNNNIQQEGQNHPHRKPLISKSPLLL